MKNSKKIFQRKTYIQGKKMMTISLTSLIYFSSALGATAIVLLAIIYQVWTYIQVSNWIVFLNFIIIMLLMALAIVVVASILKAITYGFGYLLTKLGEPDKIVVERHNNQNDKSIEIKIDNQDEGDFVGELKIIKINDEKLTTPILLGIYRNKENIQYPIKVPKDESIGVSIGMFDKILGCAYIPNVYGKQEFLYPQSRIYTKLIGTLDGDIPILKENSWFVNYELETGNNFSLSNLDEMGVNIGFGISMKINPSIKRNWKKYFGFFKK